MNTKAGRREFLKVAGAVMATGAVGAGAQQEKPNAQDAVQLSKINAATEKTETTPGPFEGPDQRVGFAVVGLGRLSLDQILPAMGKSQYCRPVALVSGDREKAKKIAVQYGIAESSVYDYAGFDRLAENKAVQVIYIVLPNSLHAEYVVRGAKAGKHILCEKPMATNVADCERMIAACKSAGVKLMIAYRSQYESYDKLLVKMIRDGKAGEAEAICCDQQSGPGGSFAVAVEARAGGWGMHAGCGGLLSERGAVSVW